MPFACPQCGASFAGDETCQDRFTLSQWREIELPAYYAVHHLSVPCYRLQHNAYSRAGWLAVRELVWQFVYAGLTPAMARRQYRVQFQGRRRAWSFTKGARLPGVESIAWTSTIADVRLDTAETFGADVRRWAASILADSDALVRAAADLTTGAGRSGRKSREYLA